MFVGLDLRGVVDDAMHVLALPEDQVRSFLHKLSKKKRDCAEKKSVSKYVYYRQAV